MKYKKKVVATVEICASGLRIPEGSLLDIEIVNLARNQGICNRVEVKRPARVPKKSYKLLLYSVIIIAILFVLLKTIFSVDEETSVTTSKPRFRVCLTVFGSKGVDAQTAKTFLNE